MSSTQGIAVIGVYAAGNPVANAAALAAIIPNVDAAKTGTGSIAGGPAGTFPAGRLNSYLDEMSPGAAVQLQVELAAMAAVQPVTYGQYTALAGDASANLINIATGLTGGAPTLANCAATIRRAGADVTVDAVLSAPGSQVLRIANGSTYHVTAGDIVTWFAQ